VCPACLSLPEPLRADFFCLSCRTPFLSAHSLDEQGRCAVCRDGMVNFDAAYSFGGYEGPLRDLIHLFKYGKVETLARPLSRLLLRALPLEERFDAVLAMPVHWRKRWRRGFNQAELLAKPVARRIGIRLSNNLKRRRYAPAQASLSEVQRRQNPANSFAVRRPQELAGKRVLLIDDVFTTGATLRAAAAALKTAGVAHVSALTLARVDRAAPSSAKARGKAIGALP
jgi:ComF family protein